MRMYRGKRKDNPKEWVRGNLIEMRDGCWIAPKGYEFVSITKHKLYGLIEVIPETVSQSTGLKDKNGVEIFGKDIIQLEYTSVPIFRRQVEFNKGAYGYYEPILDKPNFISLCYPCGNKMSPKSWIVIGNEIDNGDLLNDS